MKNHIPELIIAITLIACLGISIIANVYYEHEIEELKAELWQKELTIETYRIVNDEFIKSCSAD